MIGTQHLAMTSAVLNLASGTKPPQGGEKPGGEKPEVPENIRRAADGFESLFVAQLLAPLEQSSEAMFGTGPEGRTISGLYREQLSTSIAKARPLGVATLIEKELLERQSAMLDASSLSTAARPEGTANGLAAHATALYRKATS